MKLKNPIKQKNETEVIQSILDGLVVMRVGSFNRINNAPVYDKEKQFYRRPSKHTPKGITDIIGVFKTRAIYIETKTESEYKKIKKFIQNVIFMGWNHNTYLPKNKWQEHVIDQWRFIEEKRKHGALAFFSYSLDHVLSKINGVSNEESC